ncbi:hypothetical protein BDV37DRAFT_246182 [Aspergillus pseudonomiae]|uniref:Uncharacterized protein n=1 Tax=Aspergillus pseudonomiae TaxID=1506151 RepID=A0A5N7DF00_9EURO|nr:uncharacterized protein BDV37DRAFT_246182 [Aspergillus pseudonomiae]KAE8404957.1 hypothetical protein BDV37DRAFT_246182 [Aspergillus pseudonomiae]
MAGSPTSTSVLLRRRSTLLQPYPLTEGWRCIIRSDRHLSMWIAVLIVTYNSVYTELVPCIIFVCFYRYFLYVPQISKIKVKVWNNNIVHHCS